MKGKDSFSPQVAEEMNYHEYLDYWVCKCGNYEKQEGFMACDRYGNLLSPIGAQYCRCERCGRVIDAQKHQIIGINTNPERGRF